MASQFIIKQQINTLLEDINSQIRVIKDDAISLTPDVESLFNLRHRDGKYVMVPLLLAKAELLAGLARLEAK